MDQDNAAIIGALRENTEAWISTSSRVDVLAGRVDALEDTLEERLGHMEGQLGTMVSHLDNISRESALTRQLFEQRLEFDREDREAAREARQDRRRWAEKAASEVWSVMKQPLGLLVAAGLAYAAWAWFEVPVTPSPVPVEVEVTE